MASNQPEDTHVFRMLSPPDLCCAAEFLHLSKTNKQANKGCFALWRWSLARDFNKPLLPPLPPSVCMCVCDYLVWNQVHAVCLHDPVHHSAHLESCVWIRAVTGIRSASLLSLDFLPLSLSMINEHSVTAALTFTPLSLVPTRRFNLVELRLLQAQWTQWVRGLQSVGTWSEGGCFEKSKGSGRLAGKTCKQVTSVDEGTFNCGM